MMTRCQVNASIFLYNKETGEELSNKNLSCERDEGHRGMHYDNSEHIYFNEGGFLPRL